MKNFLKKYWWGFLIAFLLIFYFFPKQKKPEKTYVVKKENLKEELTLSGKVESEEKVNLRFQTSGRLSWVGVKVGDRVKKYQALASLDQRDLKNRLQKYLNAYASTRLEFDRSKEVNWNKQFDLSESIRKEAELLLKQNQYSLEQTVLDVEYQNLLLEYANLYSPIDGIVTKVETPIQGVNITPTSSEIEIVNPETLYFQALADQTEVINLSEKQRGKIIFDSFANKEIETQITYIGFTPNKNEAGTVYEVKTSFKTDLNLKIGMTGDLIFTVKERKDVIAVPKSFIKKEKGRNFVNLKRSGKIKKQYVETGDEIDGKIIINSGLTVGDVILSF